MGDYLDESLTAWFAVGSTCIWCQQPSYIWVPRHVDGGGFETWCTKGYGSVCVCKQGEATSLHGLEGQDHVWKSMNGEKEWPFFFKAFIIVCSNPFHGRVTKWREKWQKKKGVYGRREGGSSEWAPRSFCFCFDGWLCCVLIWQSNLIAPSLKWIFGRRQRPWNPICLRLT